MPGGDTRLGRNAMAWMLAPLLAALLTACGSEPPPPPAAAPPAVTAISVGADNGAAPVLLTGTVRARREAALAFPVAGRVAQLNVDEGDQVRAGQLLARLDTMEIDAAVAAARAEVARAQAERDRQRELFARGWVARARVDAAEASARAAEAQLASRGFAQRYARIVAPSDGVVLSRLVEQGQMVAAGAPVLALGQSNGGYVLRAAAPDRLLAGLRLGQTASVTLPALGRAPLTARIIELGGRGNERTGTFDVELALPPLAALRSGQIGEARILIARGADDRIAIPASAVWQARAGEGFVYVLDDRTRAQPRRVTLGELDDRQIVVLAGLTPGERIITGGIERVRRGMTVTVRQAP